MVLVINSKDEKLENHKTTGFNCRSRQCEPDRDVARYLGFALGATKFRQLSNGSVQRHNFESPLFRLVKDFSYTDVYSGPGNADRHECRTEVGLQLHDIAVFDLRSDERSDLPFNGGQDVLDYGPGLLVKASTAVTTESLGLGTIGLASRTLDHGEFSE